MIHRSIANVKVLIEKGVSEEKAIGEFASDIQHPDLILFKQAFYLARTQGSSISGCLERIAKVVRSRQSFRRRIKAALAMQKLSAIGILFAVITILIIQVFTNSDALFMAWDNPVGKHALVFATLMVVGGMVWIVKLSSSDGRL